MDSKSNPATSPLQSEHWDFLFWKHGVDSHSDKSGIGYGVNKPATRTFLVDPGLIHAGFELVSKKVKKTN